MAEETQGGVFTNRVLMPALRLIFSATHVDTYIHYIYAYVCTYIYIYRICACMYMHVYMHFEKDITKKENKTILTFSYSLSIDTVLFSNVHIT